MLPISVAPIAKGAVAISNDRIAAVGTRGELAARFPDASVKDFGAAAILPGLINSHTHLELTALRGYLDRHENDFSRWLLSVTAARNQAMTLEDVENSALCGAIEAARAGVTCIADIGHHGVAGVKALRAVGLRGVSYQENSFALDENLAYEKFAEWMTKTEFNQQFANDLVKIGVTPHAPYTVSRKLFEIITDYALAENLPVTIHAAESAAEREFILENTGRIAAVMQNLGIAWDAPKVSTIKYLHQIGALETAPLLAHCVNVDDEDLAIIAQTNSKIAHCPKSNAKFAHGVAPFARMLEQNLRVGLGSDSVASNNTCDLLEEARFAALMQRGRGEFVDAEQVLQAATIGGARAMNLENEIGTLEVGKAADLIVVSLENVAQQPVYDAVAALIFASSARDVVLTMVDGQTVYAHNQMQTVDEPAALVRLSQTKQKISEIK